MFRIYREPRPTEGRIGRLVVGEVAGLAEAERIANEMVERRATDHAEVWEQPVAPAVFGPRTTPSDARCVLVTRRVSECRVVAHLL